MAKLIKNHVHSFVENHQAEHGFLDSNCLHINNNHNHNGKNNCKMHVRIWKKHMQTIKVVVGLVRVGSRCHTTRAPDV